MREVLKETAHWRVEAVDRVPGARLHFRLTPLRHPDVTDIIDLPPLVRRDFWQALGWIVEVYDLTYYGLVIRNGTTAEDLAHTGSEDDQVAAYVVVGDPTSDRRAAHVLSVGTGGNMTIVPGAPPIVTTWNSGSFQ